MSRRCERGCDRFSIHSKKHLKPISHFARLILPTRHNVARENRNIMKWLDLHVGGQRWGVYLVSPNSKHLIEHTTPVGPDERSVGRCDFARCRIYIANDIQEQAREDTLLHELLHALVHVAGVDACKSTRAEENLVKALTPILHRLLKDLGFRFPRGLAQ